MASSTWHRLRPWLLPLAGCGLLFWLVSSSLTQQQPGPAKDQHKDVGKTSYDQINVPVLLGQETFATMMARDKAAKPAVMERQMALLNERYDLTRRVDEKCLMTRGKPIPVGPTARGTATSRRPAYGEQLDIGIDTPAERSHPGGGGSLASNDRLPARARRRCPSPMAPSTPSSVAG